MSYPWIRRMKMNIEITRYDNIRKAKAKIEKTKKDVHVVSLKAMIAGFFISMGAAASTIAASTITNYAIAKFVSALIFPIGLILIILVTGELFTGDCLMIDAAIDGKITPIETILFLLLVYVGNFVGALIGMYAIQSVYGTVVIDYAIKIAAAKLAMPAWKLFISGIFCNIFVCLAVLLAAEGETTVSKVIRIFIPIFTFVICGFEHSVADMFYLLTAMSFSAPVPGIVALNSLRVIGIVTLGNIVGALLLILILRYLDKAYAKKYN